MQNPYSVVGHWAGAFDETAIREWAEVLRGQLTASRVALGLVFMAPRYFAHAAQVLELLRVHGQVPLLAGCSSTGLIAGKEEIEENAGLVLGLYALPGAELRAVRFTPTQIEEANGPGYWHQETGVGPEESNGWLAFADPFNADADAWLRGWNEAYPRVPIVGGLASGDHAEQRTQVYLNGEVFENGGVAISFAQDVKIESVISQGCTPIGETWTITKAEQNIIHQIGNRPAYQVLLETFNQLAPEEQSQARGNLFIGLVVNEYLEEFHRGDFLIRNLIGADPKSGSIAVGALPRPGQTLQFQRRDARAATDDMTVLLERARQRLASTGFYGGCLCVCNGRGQRLFGYRSHDAGLVQNRLGSFGLAGFFCNGEIGPVGERNFLHGYTASLALFLKK
ncbi:MAG: FIST N-terminal domain-containing protein [Verrucomicrobiota bacterium]